MNRSERLAQQYLLSLGLGEVKFEPDGNVPPDFLVGDSVAVEVRRLNQNHESATNGHQGLEVLDISLRQRISNYLRNFGLSKEGECWYVAYDFRRPLESWKTLRPLLERELSAFMLSATREQKKVRLTKTFGIELFKAGMDHGTFFVLGSSIDQDAGGWVMSELERNLRICITEKEKKIASYRDRYPAWWLVLEDHIDHAVDQEDRPRFRSEVMSRIDHSFDRLVLLDPSGRKRAFEV